jgi:hypothetical protein
MLTFFAQQGAVDLDISSELKGVLLVIVAKWCILRQSNVRLQERWPLLGLMLASVAMGAGDLYKW